MFDTSKLSTCQIVCWGLAVVVGLLVLWVTSGAVGFFAALLLGLAVAVFVGLVITRLICTGDASEDRRVEGKDVKAKVAEVSGVTGHVAPDEDDSTAPAAEPTTTVAAAASGVTAVKSGTTPGGEEQLSQAKDERRHETEAKAKPKAAPKTKAKAAKAKATKTKPADAPAGAGTRPKALRAPKGGKADDLKQIKGVGPKLEVLCNELGFYHFDQIADWSADEITWVDQNLKGFKGRVSRDTWVDQARVLAAGGETEFSKRVAKGGVYEG